ncbi:hypothetical protein FQN51_001453 [Onygenales sp. PD_10]|nr:hypothetical protein FQN51_001453 [Onygenales sp. PD_10]
MSVILDKDAPSTAVIEFATLSPFGMELIGESFHYSIHMDGWTPFAGIDHAITAMGWQSTLTRAKDELKKGPAFVEPVEVHGPQGYLFTFLPLRGFWVAQKAETIKYMVGPSSFALRSQFRRTQEVSQEDIIQRSIPRALRWLSMRSEQDMLTGTVGNRAAPESFADMVKTG